MLLYIFIAIIFAIVLAFLNSPKFKGHLGEMMIAIQAKKFLGEEYILLNNCTLPIDIGHTTQIDHILLSPFGVFVIETKNYKGWIFGGERQKVWTQKIYRKNFKFQNPLHQNYKHIKVLESVLNDVLEPQYIHSLVVFTPESTFKTDMPANVFRGRAWTDFVKSYQEEVINPMKLKRIQHRIEKEALEKSFQTDKVHVENLNKLKGGNKY